MKALKKTATGRLEKKYPQVVTALRERIDGGLLSGALPGVKQLALEFDVNFMTVDKALRKLEAEGVVYRIPRKGTFVSRLKNIAMIFNDPNPNVLSFPIYIRLIMGLQGYLSSCNCAMIFENLTGDVERRAEILARKIDGIILLCNERFVMPKALMPLPCVQAMGVVRPKAVWDHVTYDNQRIGAIAAEHLIRRGHRRAALINCYPGLLMRIRCEAFVKAMRDGGGEAVSYPSTLTFSESETESQVSRLLSDPKRPTAVFAPSDTVLLSVCKHLRRQSQRPGVDFELVGCDNERCLWQGMDVPHVSIDLGVEAIGLAAGKRLFHRIKHPEEPRHIQESEPKLVEA